MPKLVAINRCTQCPYIVMGKPGYHSRIKCRLTQLTINAELAVDSISAYCPLPDSKPEETTNDTEA